MIHIIFSLVVAQMLFGFGSYCLADTAGKILHKELHGLVGNNYKNCGTYTDNKNLTAKQYAKLSSCVYSANMAGRSFVFSQEGYGIDSYFITGIIGLPNSGGIYSFQYDSSPSGSGCCDYAFSLTLCHHPADSSKLDLEAACGLQLKALPESDDNKKPSLNKIECAFPKLKLPEKFTIFAAGGHYGRRLGFQLKMKNSDSKNEGRQLDVTVNYQKNPVILILAAYHPSIFNIGWTDQTKIAAVVVGGFERQALAGLPANVPVLNASGEELLCGYLSGISNDPEDIKAINSLSHRLFSRAIDKIFVEMDGKVLVGEPIPDEAAINTSRQSPPASFIDKNAPTGLAAINKAVKMGVLRKATEGDINAWIVELTENTLKKDIPHIAGKDISKPRVPDIEKAYIILKPFTIPDGLDDIGLTFYVPLGIEKPEDEPSGFTTICDFNTLECYGFNKSTR